MKVHEIRDMLKLLQEIKGKIADVEPLLEMALEAKDPFSAHVVNSRKQYALEVRTSTKSGKRIDDCLHATYIKACGLGYMGKIREWREVLRPGA